MPDDVLMFLLLTLRKLRPCMYMHVEFFSWLWGTIRLHRNMEYCFKEIKTLKQCQLWIKSVNIDLHVFCEFEKFFLSFRHWEVLYVTIANPAFCTFLNLTAYISEASYSMLVTSVSKKSIVDKSELESYVASDCKT